MVNSGPRSEEQSVLGPHCLLLYLDSSVMLGNYLQQTTFSDAFFLGALRVKVGQSSFNRAIAF